jgi:hypothetical protein
MESCLSVSRAESEPHASADAGSFVTFKDVYCARYGLRYELLHVLFGLRSVMCVGTAPVGLAVEVKTATQMAWVRRQVLDLCTPFRVVVNTAAGGADGADIDDDAEDYDSDDDMRRQFVAMYHKLSRFVIEYKM